MYGTPADVIALTGIKPEDLGLDEQADPAQALTELLGVWLTRISAAINVRLNGGIVSANDPNYQGLVDVCLRTVAKLVAISQQQRSAPIVKVGEFAVNIINTSQVTKDLEVELKPYQKSSISPMKSITFFSSNKRIKKFN